MALAGRLEIEMAANIATLVQNMAQAKAVVGTSMKSIEAAVTGAKSAIQALGAGLSIHALVEMVRGVVDLNDHINDLSKSTRIAVEDLAGLRLAAKQSGSDLDSIAGAINKLSQNIGKDSEKFARLGVTAKDPIKALQQLSDVFSEIQDPQLRAAVGAEALGKQWQGAAPLLAEGGAKIAEMVKRGKELSGITKESAERADAFNDKLAELDTAFAKTKTKMVGDMLEPMTEISKAVTQAAEDSGNLTAAWVALGGAAAFVLGQTSAQQARTRITLVTEQLVTARKQLDAALKSRPEDSWFGFLIRDLNLTEKQITRLRGLIQQLEKEKRDLEAKPIQLSVFDSAQNQRELNRANTLGADQKAMDFLKGTLKEEQIAAAHARVMQDLNVDYLDKESQLNESAYRDGLQSLESYYANREVIRVKKLAAETSGLEAQIAAQRTIENDVSKTADERTAAHIKIVELLAQEQKQSLASSVTFELTQREQIKAIRDLAAAINKPLIETLKQLEDAQQAANAALAERGQRFSEERQDAQQNLSLIGLEVSALAELGPNYGELTRKTLEYHVQRETLLRTRQLDNDELREEIRLNGLNLSEIDLAIAKEKLYQQTRERRAQIPQEVRDALSAQSQLNEAKTLADAQLNIQVDMYRSLDDTARQTFRSIFDSGKGTFERLRDTLKNTLYDLLYQMTLRPFLIQVVATVAGTDVARGAFGAAGTLATSGGVGGTSALSGLSNVGNILSAFNSSLPSIGTALQNVSGAFNTFTTMVGNGTGVIDAFQAATAGIAPTLTTLSPYIGIALQLAQGNFKGAAFTAAGAAIGSIIPGVGTVIGAAVGSIVSSLIGGSKKISARMIDSGGLGFTGEGQQFFSRGSQGAMDVSSAVSKGIQEAAKGLAITLPSYGVGFGSNTGNQGANPNFSISASVGTGIDYGNQRNVFASGEEMGQSNPLDQATIALRSAQAMLAVLREGDMPGYLRKFFDSLKPIASMSADDVNAAIQAAGQLKSAYDLLAKIADLSNLSASADQLIELFGDVQTAVPLLQSYFDNFFTDAEKQAQGLKQVDDAMVQLGITTIPKTRQEFRALVETQDRTTDAGKAMFRSLIAIAPAFAAVTDALDATADAALSLQDQLSKAQSDAIDLIQDQISASRDAAKAAHDNADAYRAAGQSLMDAIRSLRQGSLSTLLPGQKLSEARGTLDSVFQQALSGDRGALAQLPSMAQDFLQASRDFNASSQAYSSDFARVMQMLEQAGVASGTFAGQQDYLATTLDVQTGVLQDILSTLQAPTPELDKLNDQLAVLQAVQGLLGDATRSILTVNSSIVDQTGQVISGNSMISAQTGEIVSLPRLIASYDYTVLDPALRGVLSVTDPAVLEQAQQLLSAAGPLAQGQYAIQDATGRVYAATVDQTGVVAALNEITRDQAGAIALGNALLDAQTHQIVLGNTTLDARTGELVQGIDQQTGQVVAGNSTSDAIRNLTARDTSVSEEMLVQLAQNSTTQSSQFATMVDGINRTVQAMNTLIGLQQQMTAAEAARVAAEEAAAAKQAQIATQQAALSSAAAMQGSVIAEINAGIQGITDLKKTFGGYVEPINAQGQYATFEVRDGKFFSDFADVLYSSGRSDLAEQFKTQFMAPGGLYDQVFGKAAELSSLTQQIQTLRDLITSMGGIPSHAAGLDRVPHDDYYARLHRDEAVLTASEAAVWRSGGRDSRSWAGGGYSSDDADRICAAIERVEQKIDRASDRNVRAMDKQSMDFAGGQIRAVREQFSRTRNRDDAQRTKSR